jgi:hypothetical protein
MGNLISYSGQEKAKVKLDSEKIRDFAGADDEWQKMEEQNPLCIQRHRVERENHEQRLRNETPRRQ